MFSFVTISYGCDSLEAKYMSCINHGLIVSTPCKRCRATSIELWNQIHLECGLLKSMTQVMNTFEMIVEDPGKERRNKNMESNPEPPWRVITVSVGVVLGNEVAQSGRCGCSYVFLVNVLDYVQFAPQVPKGTKSGRGSLFCQKW